MELNAEQIIKDLECCRFGKDEAKCKECNWHPWIKPRCWRLLASDALALIKELTEDVVPKWEVDKARQEGYESGKRDNVYGFTAEELAQKVEQLTEENERLREDNEIKSQKRANIFEIANAYERGKADTVRKMHSMLCEGRVSNDNVVIVANQIAKEMLEGNDESKG